MSTCSCSHCSRSDVLRVTSENTVCKYITHNLFLSSAKVIETVVGISENTGTQLSIFTIFQKDFQHVRRADPSLEPV